jgi:hypothetical protein
MSTSSPVEKPKKRLKKELATFGLCAYVLLTLGYNADFVMNATYFGDMPREIWLAYEQGDISKADLCPNENRPEVKPLCQELKSITLSFGEDLKWRADYDSMIDSQSRAQWITNIMPYPMLAIESSRNQRLVGAFHDAIAPVLSKFDALHQHDVSMLR